MNETQGVGDALVIGAGGGIGGAVVDLWSRQDFGRVWAVSRSTLPEATPTATPVLHRVTDHSSASIAQIVEELVGAGSQLRRVAICLGTLHGDAYSPEKNLESLSAEAMAEVYRVNCVLPLLWLSALAKGLRRADDCRIAVLSARVGSIGDNGLGGWYSYRASKAALNMGLKTAAIELGRRARGVKLIAFHPGTVDTTLSKPFQRGVPEGKLFDTEFVAEQLDAVLSHHGPDGSLSYLDWNNKPIPW